MKERLPLTSANFGDLAGHNEYGSVIMGPLICTGGILIYVSYKI